MHMLIAEASFAALVPILLIVGIVAFLLSRARDGGGPPSPFVAKRLLTDHEKAFYPKLVEAARLVGCHAVFPQVAMGAIVDARPGLEPRDRMATRGRFSQKIVDFVLVDRNLDAVLIVELDDRTHVREADERRDAITAAAGHPTARFVNGRTISVAAIEKGLRTALSGRAPR